MIPKMYCGESMRETQIKECFRQLKSGRTLVESGPQSVRPAMAKTP